MEGEPDAASPLLDRPLEADFCERDDICDRQLLCADEKEPAAPLRDGFFFCRPQYVAHALVFLGVVSPQLLTPPCCMPFPPSSPPQALSSSPSARTDPDGSVTDGEDGNGTARAARTAAGVTTSRVATSRVLCVAQASARMSLRRVELFPPSSASITEPGDWSLASTSASDLPSCSLPLGRGVVRLWSAASCKEAATAAVAGAAADAVTELCLGSAGVAGYIEERQGVGQKKSDGVAGGGAPAVMAPGVEGGLEADGSSCGEGGHSCTPSGHSKPSASASSSARIFHCLLCCRAAASMAIAASSGWASASS